MNKVFGVVYYNEVLSEHECHAVYKDKGNAESELQKVKKMIKKGELGEVASAQIVEMDANENFKFIAQMPRPKINYWIRRTGIYENNVQKDINENNHNVLMKNINKKAFGNFLAEIGMSQKESIDFLIETLSYVNENPEKFHTDEE